MVQVTSLSLRHTMALVLLFVALAVTLIALDNRHTLDPLKSGLRAVVGPVADWVDEALDRDDSISSLEIQLQQVTEERDQLLRDYAQLKLELEDVDSLRNILGVQESNPNWELVAANVINVDPTGLQKFITIDRGSLDGLEVGMAVIDPYYLVGLITEVEERSAKVTLIIDATSAVGAKLLETKGVGVVYGRWQYGGRLELQHVDREVEPQDGELVVTSDETDARTARVPGGLIIGVVTGEPAIDNQSDSQTIQVHPGATFETLSVVAVIVSDQVEE
jgi:rod shape-determining protein MreC